MELSPNGRVQYQNIKDVSWDTSKRMISLEQEQIPIPMETFDQSINDDNGKTKAVDFVLAYVDNRNQSHMERRELFESELRDQGLELEYEQNRQLCFVKIHAPQEVLCRYCEILKIRMPIKQLPSENTVLHDSTDFLDDARSWFARLFSFVQLDPNKFPPREYQLAAEFSRDKDYLFDIQNENFFPTNVRAMVVDFILERQSEGIQTLLAQGVYCAAYPLHDGTYKERGSIRALLYEEWGATSKWLKLQPIDTIQEYFGVNFALYFAWLGFYTYMLIPASIAGLICFFYGLVTLSSNQLARDACDPDANNVIMCPQCDKTCDYWRLSETCLLTRVTHLFDNPATTIFAIFMSFWATLYLELWRRRSAELSYHWGLGEWDRTAEHPRPQYLAALSNSKILKIKEKVNTVTREKELHVSFWKVRVPATFFSFSVVLLLASVAVAAVFAVVLYRMSMITSNSLFGREVDSTSYKMFALPAIAAAINLVCILILNYVYDWLAVYLTEMEFLRTQTEFDDSLTLKIYLFQFINYYASIFYVAFLKGKFVGYPKKYNRILGYRQEECSPGGCLMELCIQLAIIMVGKQALYTAMEMIWPVLFKWWALFRIHTGLKQKDPIVSRSQWIRDFKLLEWGPRGLYDEYLEMIIQFGFITLFVVAFPLAPLFALANNVLEMRLDATKFLRHYRRPVPRRARDIGIWARILVALTRISVTTNAFIIAFSSNFIPRLVYMAAVSQNKTDTGFLNHSLAYFNTADFANGTGPLYSSFDNVTMCRYVEYRNPPDHTTLPYKRPTIYWHILAARLAFIVVFQNVVGVVTMAVQWCLSGIPRKLRDRIKREAFLTESLIITREAERARQRSRSRSNTLANVINNAVRKRTSTSHEDT
ncbi:anoctamin-5 [Cephus cinctus]|uniref:Anoctamin n=1 Tax=Cephus cinctus TaxID=211228 RepID=A0AAJ7CAM8_CEPCN|nr:anoctamin-5 [Cephus cinctus]XP_015606041.1 anoctamin-5 [Cephus cinctus]XP_015606043.1 anoctamin-5 [Cephus cinctus]XP_015606045.1 anoctamin-5 [Cephus cinctus]XP_024945942.1 anoctamin-5 [Cephus cinctus]